MTHNEEIEKVFVDALPLLDKILEYIKVHREDDDLSPKGLHDYLEVVDYCDAIYGIFEYGLPDEDNEGIPF